MSSKRYDQHQIISELKELTKQLGKVPTRIEFERQIASGRNKIRSLFDDNYGRLIQAADLASYHNQGRILLDDGKLLRQYQKLCQKTEKIQGFYRHVLDLKEMFARAGNPQTLKGTAQPDTHMKFADKAALRAYLKFLRWYDPHFDIILGDLADCEGLSHWPDDSLEPRRIVPEMKQVRSFLQEKADASPNCKSRVFTCGNHELWMEQAFARMPELFEDLQDLDIDISIKKLMGLDKFGYEFFPVNHLVQIGQAHFTHGIYTSGTHAKKHLDVFKCNIFYGHLHDTQSHNQTSVLGPMVAQSLGCLCRQDAKFLKGKPNNWEHAFGVFEFFPDGTFTYLVPKIINGRLSFCGQIFDGNT